MSEVKISPNLQSGHSLLGKEAVLLHCYHYNISLQETILLPEYIDGYEIQFQAASESAWEMVKGELGDNNDIQMILKTGAALFKEMGLGILEFDISTREGGIISMPYSHFGYGYYDVFGNVRPEAFVFPAGFIAGVLALAFETNYEVKLIESGQKSLFRASPRSGVYNPLDVTKKISTKELLKDADTKSYFDQPNIDCKSITDTIRQNLPSANEQGLIKEFGVYLTYLPANYYNRISYRFEELLDEIGGIPGLSAPLLVEAGHVCGFNTFGGIMKSDIWKNLVLPNVKSKEDWILAIFAIINAFGWGHWRITDIVPEKKISFTVTNSAEVIGHRSEFGKSDEAKCYMAQGASKAILNLLYLGVIEKKPVLDQTFYLDLFSREDSFSIEESKCVSKGDDYCEFSIFK